jgi:hypothetical protein
MRPVSFRREDVMAELRLPPAVKLWLEVVALRRQVKMRQTEVTDLKARLATLEPSDAV